MIKIKAIYEELEQCTNDLKRLDLLFDLATGLLNFDEKRSLEVADEISTLAEKLNNNKGRSYYHSAKARVFFKKSQYAQAAMEFNKALTMAMLTDDLVLQAICQDSLGVSYCQQNKCDEALLASNKALETLQQITHINTLGYQITAYNNIGNVYKRLNDTEKAEATYLQGLKLAEEANDVRIKCNLLNNLCAISLVSHRYAQGLVYAQKALAGFKSLNHKHGEVHAQVFMGYCLAGMGEYAKAMDCYIIGLKMLKQVDHKPIEAYTYKGMADVYMHMGALPEALKNLKKGMEIVAAIKDYQEITEFYVAIVKTYIAMGNHQEALKTAQAGINLAEEHNITNELVQLKALQTQLQG